MGETDKPRSGFLLVHKPVGMTSHDVVDAVRRALGVRRVGHSGTLDPNASGLLILGVGAATKRLGEFQKLPKTYEADITLGATSTTDDAEGTITSGTDRHPTREEIEDALRSFVGTIAQIPPAYAAVKVKGERAYTRARRGETVDLSPRPVTISELTLLSYAYPTVRVRCVVSSGTYIRALARDVGATLGTGAYLSALVRTAIGSHTLADALPLPALPNASLRELP